MTSLHQDAPTTGSTRSGRPRSPENSSRPRHLSFEKLPSILLAILLLASPLLIGGVHFLTAAFLTTLAILGLWIHLFSPSPRSQTHSFFLSIPTLAISAMVLFSLIQLLPIPTFLYQILQPGPYQDLLATWPLHAGAPPPSGWHFLSVDPAATASVALKWTALAAISALAAQVIRHRHQRPSWLGITLITAALVALAGLLQHLSSTELILGFYQAEVPARSFSPFVNTNHAASYYGLIALVALCFGYDKFRSSPLLATAGFAAALIALGLATAHGSKGANLAIVLSLATLTLGLLWRSQSSRDRLPPWLSRGLPLLLLIGALSVFFLPRDWTLSQTDSLSDITTSASAEARLQMISAALEGSLHYPFVGSGAGSVDRAMTRFVDWELFGSHAIPTVENEPVEWILTYGPLIALFTLLVFAFLLFRTGSSLLSSRPRRGSVYAFALLLYLGVISFFHFPFITLGISAVALIVIEACLRPSRDGLHLSLSPLHALLFTSALTLATFGLTLATFTILAPGPEETLKMDDPAALEQALWRYPTDGRLLSAVALQHRIHGDPDTAVALSEEALRLRPHPQQEFLLARAYAHAGKTDRAADLYGRLLQKDRTGTGLNSRIRDRLPGDLPDPDHQARALLPSSDSFLSHYLRWLANQQSPTAAISVAHSLIALDPLRPTPHLELIELYRRADQLELAEIYARSLINRNLVAADGERPAGLLPLLALLRRQNQPDEALMLARRAFDANLATPALARATLEIRPPDGPRSFDETLLPLFEEALHLGCPSPYETRTIQRQCWLARAFLAEVRGDLDQARSLLTRVDRHHSDPRPLARMLARNGLCRDLASLQRDHRDSSFSSALERSARDCARFPPDRSPD